MQKYTYHCHTTFSDGKSSIKEMLDQAVRLGFTEIGISDHLAVHKNFIQSPSWPRFSEYYAPHIYRNDFKSAINDFQRHADNIRLIAANYPLKVYVGAEVDYMIYDGWLDEFADFRKQVDLDYCLTGNHYVFSADGETLYHPRDIAVLFSAEEQEIIIRRHFNTLTTAVKSGLFDFLAHLDFMRKAAVYTQERFMPELDELLKALAVKNMPAEVSSKGLRKSGEPYPVLPLIEKMRRSGIPVVISDDAHHAEDLGADFDKIEKILQKMNYTNRWKLNKD